MLGMFEMMTVNCNEKTLQKSIKKTRNVYGDSDQEDQDDDGMDIITQAFDPKGVRDCVYFERKSKISKLTELKP